MPGFTFVVFFMEPVCTRILYRRGPREGFSVSGLRWSGGRLPGLRGCGRDGADAEESARIVIGADGYHSIVAKNVGATNTIPIRPLRVVTTLTGAALPSIFRPFTRDLDC